jgi:membrane-associated phospholipid phosphatase
MSRMSWRAVPGPERLVLLSAPGRDAVLATAAVLLTAGVFAAVGEHGTLTSVQRPRPPGSLVVTTGTSFPSGHAVAASVTVIAAVIALVPPGRRRAWGPTGCRTLSPGSCSGCRAPSSPP